MRLRTKFFLLIGSIVLVSFGVTFLRVASFQQELVLTQAERQARIIHKQILLTRRWISDHKGIFLEKLPGVDVNPFLSEGEIRDDRGRWYVKRNPAMVTRELSVYAADEGLYWFRITSLQPINQDNAPDPFERESLGRFEAGAREAIAIEETPGGRVLRYMAPLMVESSCLECHGRQGYIEGDIRGGLSVSIPMGWVDDTVARNDRMLFLIGMVTVLLVGVSLYVLMDILVVRRLSLLAAALERLPAEDFAGVELPSGADEIGTLAERISDLCRRLVASRKELMRTREQMFQSEKLAALGRLSAGVAHEINNPLGGMLNCVKRLEDRPHDEDLRRRYLPLLSRGLNRIGYIVRQLLNFGRKDPLQFRTARIDEVVRECLVLLEYRMRNIEVVFDLNLGHPHPVDVDALQQVVVNVAMNAIQAMPDGGRLLVKTWEGTGSMHLAFEDTGTGIEKENLDKIFDPFFTTKEVGEGTGLGLSVTYSLVERMGGTIDVESAVGRGTRFVVTLPLPRAGSVGTEPIPVGSAKRE